MALPTRFRSADDDGGIVSEHLPRCDDRYILSRVLKKLHRRFCPLHHHYPHWRAFHHRRCLCLWRYRPNLKEFSAVAGGFALAIPHAAHCCATEQALRLIPTPQRLASSLRRQPLSNDLSHRRCRNTCTTTGILLAVARAAGETAPLLFTALFSQIGRRFLVLLLPIRINFTTPLLPFLSKISF